MSSQRLRKKSETLIGGIILLLLIFIAISVFFRHLDYNPAVKVAANIRELSFEAPVSTAPDFPELTAFLPEDVTALSAPEEFTPENLYEKINGKAETYLSAGFLRLKSQRFALKEDKSAWIEVFVYDMGSTQNAFAVYSVQKRADSEEAGFTRFAYSSENALFFMNGRYYAELIASGLSGQLADAMLKFGQNFVTGTEVTAEALDEIELFPPQGLDPGSISLLISDAFGFERLDKVYIADYTTLDSELVSFLSRRSTAAEAVSLVEAYEKFLVENGASQLKPGVDIPGARLLEFFDSYELFFSRGEFMAGVHMSPSLPAAEKLALELYLTLSGTGE